MRTFRSPGKLLISGEYAVLDGAAALAVPTKYGQVLEARISSEDHIYWKGFDVHSRIWIEGCYKISEISSAGADLGPADAKARLLQLLKQCYRLNPEGFKNGLEISTWLEFPAEWGLGSSSTLIANLSRLFEVDPFELLESTFGGSGYDIAVALEQAPILYRQQGKMRTVLKSDFYPAFRDRLFFVHLNQKRNSRKAITDYRSRRPHSLSSPLEKISSLSHKMAQCKELPEFELLVQIHENLISQLTGQEKVKATLFPDFPGQIKSLGAWGGDFVLATGKEEEMEYFKKKGYPVVISYEEMVLSC